MAAAWALPLEDKSDQWALATGARSPYELEQGRPMVHARIWASSVFLVVTIASLTTSSC